METLTENIEPLKQLDSILLYFIEINLFYLSDTEIQKHCSLNNLDIFPLLDRLIEDGYVKQVPRTQTPPFVNQFWLTVNGKIFIQNTGYVKQQRQYVISNRNEYIQTLILTYGTGAAGVYGFFEIMKWIFHHEAWKIPF